MTHRYRYPRSAHRRLRAAAPATLALVLASLMAGCASRLPAAMPGGASTAVATPGPPVIRPDYGPLHDARVGPYRFRVPAAYFRHQSGPYFDGSWGLHIRWPDLGPVPLGQMRSLMRQQWAHTVSIDFAYIDKLDIRELLDRRTRPLSHLPEALEDPAEGFAGRIRGAQVHGLTPWRVDMAAFRRYVDRHHDGNPAVLEPNNRKDWYVAYTPEGRLRTLIICDPADVADQYVIEGPALRDLGGTPVPQCRHHFNLVDHRIAIALSYNRAVLRDWAVFERRAVELFDGMRIAP